MKRLWLIAAAAAFLFGTAQAADHSYTRDNGLTAVRKQKLLSSAQPQPQLPDRSQSQSIAANENSIIYSDGSTSSPEAYAQLDAPRKPFGMLAFMPYYFHSANKEYDVDFQGQHLTQGKARGNGAGAFLVFKKFFNERFDMDFIVGHFFLTERGKALTPSGMGLSGELSRVNKRTHTSGWILQPNIKWGKWGETKLSWLQSFDRSNGHSYWFGPNGSVALDQDHKNDGSNGTALMVWHQMPIPVNERLTITPFVGWRSLYAVAKSGDQVMDTSTGVARIGLGKADDTHVWAHVAMGGVKAEYRAGRMSFWARGGFAYRLSKTNIPAYGNFAIAPDTYFLSHRPFLNRATGSAGLGITYAFNPAMIVTAEYDGAITSKTSAHLANVNFILAF